MIRNHMMNADPESSPAKLPDDGNGYLGGSPMTDTGDPWYTSGAAPESPSSGMGGGSGGMFGFKTYSGDNDLNMNNNMRMSGIAGPGIDEDDYDNEPPLLEELGIHFNHIWSKTQAVLYPTKRLDDNILADADLAGPVCYCLLLGSCLLLAGKVQFGYIYGFSVFGCVALHAILHLIHPVGLDFWRTCSVLGYCLLPVIGLAALSILLSMKGVLGLILSTIVIAWSTTSATRLIDAKLHLTELYWLVAYPIMLLYSCFVLITVF